MLSFYFSYRLECFLAENCVDRDLRLMDFEIDEYDYSETQQFVLVCMGNRWGPICSNYGSGNSDVLCKQFGYDEGELTII